MANCVTVFFPTKKIREEMHLVDDGTFRQKVMPTKQPFVLLLIIFANFVYYFGTIGFGSIFTLFLMNKPLSMDSIAISNYTVFGTVITLTSCLFVSRLIKLNDLIICIFSCLSFFTSLFFYIYGSSVTCIYLGEL